MAARSDITPEKAAAHWAKTKALMWTCLIIWFIFGFAIHLFADALNDIVIIGFPLGWYFAAQGSLIVFVIICFWFASKQNRIDEEFGMSGHEE